jgi:hypothetical protein
VGREQSEATQPRLQEHRPQIEGGIPQPEAAVVFAFGKNVHLDRNPSGAQCAIERDARLDRD